MFIEYIFIFKYFIFSFIVSLVLFILSIIFVYQKPDSEKLSSHECGFNPFNDARSKFEVRFYSVGILFIVFDSEIIYLYP
jgi:NADH:ubiquinone oxidoreductase subunit 3 (subunit A)